MVKVGEVQLLKLNEITIESLDRLFENDVKEIVNLWKNCLFAVGQMIMHQLCAYMYMYVGAQFW